MIGMIILALITLVFFLYRSVEDENCSPDCQSVENLLPEINSPEVEVCAICLDDSDLMALSCGHKYHDYCIAHWVSIDPTEVDKIAQIVIFCMMQIIPRRI